MLEVTCAHVFDEVGLIVPAIGAVITGKGLLSRVDAVMPFKVREPRGTIVTRGALKYM